MRHRPGLLSGPARELTRGESSEMMYWLSESTDECYTSSRTNPGRRPSPHPKFCWLCTLKVEQGNNIPPYQHPSLKIHYALSVVPSKYQNPIYHPVTTKVVPKIKRKACHRTLSKCFRFQVYTKRSCQVDMEEHAFFSTNAITHHILPRLLQF